LISLFRAVQEGGYADFKAFATNKHGAIVPVRICAKRKTVEQIKESLKKMKDRERKCCVSEEVKI